METWRRRAFLSVIVVATVFLLWFNISGFRLSPFVLAATGGEGGGFLAFADSLDSLDSNGSWCPIPKPVSPAHHRHLPPSSEFSGDLWIKKQVYRLSAAVEVPTESWDDNGDVDQDSRWKPFHAFQDVLKDIFPQVHQKANLTIINRYGLVYTLRGSSKHLKLILLTAHQDVVPAGPVDEWSHPPFQPYFDGTFLWGRGSSDCKNNLVGILSTLEFLLEKSWAPNRTVVLAFGFDEETGGVRGAARIARFLEDAWGTNGVGLIVDEGGMGLQLFGKHVYARPAVAEKGYMDAELIIETKGGHSSRPPPHSGIGIMSEMIVALEGRPYQPKLTKENPFRGYLQCQARFSPDELEPWLRKALEADEPDIGTRLANSRRESVRWSMQTSQAVDVIKGGAKVNAMPESVTAIINYRLATHDSLDAVKSNILRYLHPIAQKHYLDVQAFDGYNASSTTASNSHGTLYLRSLNDLGPSPISPTDFDADGVWHLFGATIRSVFESAPALQGATDIPVGDVMTGNTDTIQYWQLTKNIYRFSPRRDGTSFGVHTVDERMEMEAHLEGMRFYYEQLLNFDAWDGKKA